MIEDKLPLERKKLNTNSKSVNLRELIEFRDFFVIPQ